VSLSDFFGEVLHVLFRDGLIEAGKWLFGKKTSRSDPEREKILARRRRDRHNRRKNK